MKKIIIAVMLMSVLCGCASKSAENSLSNESTNTTVAQSDSKAVKSDDEKGNDSSEYKVEFETIPNGGNESAENDSEESTKNEEFVLPEVPLD